MFRFKQFLIEQDRTSMKVGTDGVLLGAWVSLSGDERRILDIGTGSGVIALMMAQRTMQHLPQPHVDGVEIDANSAEQAQENVKSSMWSNRVAIYHADIQTFNPIEFSQTQFESIQSNSTHPNPTNFNPTHKYDLIVTNPPYFVDSLLSPDKGRTTARHTASLPFTELVSSVERLLTPDGRFALILPTNESQIFQEQARGGLTLLRRCNVYSRENAPIKRVMSEYRLASHEDRAQTPPPPKCEEITIEGGSPPQFTAEYRELTRDFYLKF